MAERINIKTRRQLVGQYQMGRPIMAICQEYSVPRSTMYHWAKQYRTQITNTGVVVTPKEFDSARRKIKKYEDIIAVLKAVDCTVGAPLKYRLAALEKLHGKYSVHTLCDALEVPRGTFYNHILRNRRGDAWYVKRRLELAEAIRDIFDGSNQVFGVGKIRAVLVGRGYEVSEKLVSELMREMDLRSIRTMSKKENYIIGINEAKVNKLKRVFDVDAPNKVWVSDMTLYRLNGKNYYICVYIELFSRRVLALVPGRNASTHLAKLAFTKAYGSRECAVGMILHSDQGAAYTSYSMGRELRSKGVVRSFSSPGKPRDNAVAEAFFNSLKKEELYRRRYSSEVDFKQSLQKYVHFYNYERPHKYLGYGTPAQFEDSFWNNAEK